MPPLRPSGDSPQTFGNLTPDSGEEQQWARPRDSDSSAQTQVSTQTAGAQTETAVPPRDRYTRKKKSGAKESDPRKLLENAGRSLGKLWSETKQGVKAELATHRDENGELNAKGELFYARIHAASKNYEEALALYDKLLARCDATYEVLPKDFDAKIIQKERGDALQAQFLGLQAELEKTFKKFNQTLWDKQKGLGENLEGLSYVAGHFKTALEKLLAKIEKVSGVSERRTLLVLLFSQTTQSPCAKLLGEISEKFLLQCLDGIEEDLRQGCSNYERLEIYQSLWISLGELPSDKLRYRISRQGDAVADHLSHQVSSGNSAEERAAQLILARDYYQVRGDMEKVQQVETRLLGLQKSIALAISDEGVPGYRPEAEVEKFKEGKAKLAKLSLAIDESLLANVAPGPEGEGLIAPLARSERHARHLRALAEQEAALAHRSNTERWAGLQGLSLKAASDQSLALQKDSPLIPSILETSHSLLQNQILALVSSELLGAEAPALDSMSELGERGLVIRLFVTRYAQALKDGDASWILAHVSASGLMRWQQKLQAAFSDLDKAEKSADIVQLRFSINALHAFAKLGLAEEVRKISESLIRNGEVMLSSPGTLFKDYQKGATVAVPFNEQDYYHFLLKAAKLCLDKKLMGEAQFLLDKILAHEGEHSMKISQVEEEGPEAQSIRNQEFQLKNIFVLARAYRLESEGKRPEAKALADQLAEEEKLAMLFDDKSELQQSPNVANSLELLASRSGIPASELSDKIRHEELFKANQAAAKALNFYLLELEQLYRAQARSIQGQFKDDLSELLPEGWIDPGDKNLRSLKEAQALCHQLIEKLQSGRINSLREGLDLSEGDFPQLPEFDKIRSLLARFHDQLSSDTKAKKILGKLNFQDEIVPLIIELVSSYPHDLGLAQRLLELADDFEHEHDAVAGPLAIYRFLEEIAPHSELATHRISTSPEGGPTDPSGSEGPGGSGLPSPTLASLQSLQNQARKNRDRLTGRADFAQAFQKFFRNLSTTEELISIGLLVGSGFLGAAARAELMAEEVFVGMARTSSGFAYRNYVRQHIIPNFAFRVPGLGLTSIEHIAAFGQGLLTMDLAFNFASIAHEKWVGDPTLEQMIYGSIARSTTLIGFELGGPLSRALLERGARTLGMTTATGHLSRAGQATVWTGTHASGIATAVGIGTLNEELGLTPPPPGGPNEAWLLHVFGYAKLIWAKALVNKVMGGKLAAFEHQPQLEYTVLLARHRVQIALQKARLSLSPAEEALLIDQLAATRLHNPLFTDDKLKDLLQAIQDHVLKPNASSADPSSPYRRAQGILEEFNISIRLRQGPNLLRFDWTPRNQPQLGFEAIPEEQPESGLPEENIPPAANTGLPTAARAGKGLGVALATGILLGAASPTPAEAEVGQSVATESAPEKVETEANSKKIKKAPDDIKASGKGNGKAGPVSSAIISEADRTTRSRQSLKKLIHSRYSSILGNSPDALPMFRDVASMETWVDGLTPTQVEFWLAIARLPDSGTPGQSPFRHLVQNRPDDFIKLQNWGEASQLGLRAFINSHDAFVSGLMLNNQFFDIPSLESLLSAYAYLTANLNARKNGFSLPNTLQGIIHHSLAKTQGINFEEIADQFIILGKISESRRNSTAPRLWNISDPFSNQVTQGVLDNLHLIRIRSGADAYSLDQIKAEFVTETTRTNKNLIHPDEIPGIEYNFVSNNPVPQTVIDALVAKVGTNKLKIYHYSDVDADPVLVYPNSKSTQTPSGNNPPDSPIDGGGPSEPTPTPSSSGRRPPHSPSSRTGPVLSPRPRIGMVVPGLPASHPDSAGTTATATAAGKDRGEKRTKEKEEPAKIETAPEPTAPPPGPSAKLAEPALSGAKLAFYEKTKDDAAFLKALAENPSYGTKKGGSKPSNDELRASWAAFIDTLSDPQVKILEGLGKVKRVFHEGSKRQVEPFLCSLVRDPEKLKFFSGLSGEAFQGFERKTHNNPDFIVGFFEIDPTWRSRENYGKRIFISYYYQDLAKVAGRDQASNALVNPHDWENKFEFWRGFANEDIAIGEAAKRHLQNTTLPKPTRSNPNLGPITWVSQVAGAKLTESIKPDLLLIAPGRQKIYREYKSAGELDKTQAEKYALAAQRSENQNDRWEYVFYSHPGQETLTYLEGLFKEHKDFGIYIEDVGNKAPRLIAGKELSALPATTTRVEPRVEAPPPLPEVDLPEPELTEVIADEEQESPSKTRAPRLRTPKAQLDPSLAQWPYESVESNMSDNIRSRFDGTAMEDFVDRHPNALFYFNQGRLVAFRFESEINSELRTQIAARELLNELQKKSVQSSKLAEKLQTEARWVLEIIRRQEPYSQQLVEGFKNHVLADNADPAKALEWIDRQLNAALNDEKILVILDEKDTKSSEVKINVGLPSPAPGSRYLFIYIPPERQEQELAGFEHLQHRARTASFPIKMMYKLSPDMEIYDRPQARPDQKVLVMLVDPENLAFFSSQKVELGRRYFIIGGEGANYPFHTYNFDVIFQLKNNNDFLINPNKLDVEAALWSENYTAPLTTAPQPVEPAVPPVAQEKPKLLEGIADPQAKKILGDILDGVARETGPGKKPGKLLVSEPDSRPYDGPAEVKAQVLAETQGKNLGPLAAKISGKVRLASIRLASGAAPADAAALIAELASGADAAEAQRNLDRLTSLSDEEAEGMAELLTMSNSIDQNSFAKKLFIHPLLWEEGTGVKTRGQKLLQVIRIAKRAAGVRNRLGVLLARKPGDKGFKQDEWLADYKSLVDNCSGEPQRQFVAEHRRQGHIILFATEPQDTKIKAYATQGSRNEEYAQKVAEQCAALKKNIHNAKDGFNPHSEEAKLFFHQLDQLPLLAAYAKDREYKNMMGDLSRSNQKLADPQKIKERKPWHVYRNEINKFITAILTNSSASFVLQGEQDLLMTQFKEHILLPEINTTNAKKHTHDYYLYLDSETYFKLLDEIDQSGQMTIPQGAMLFGEPVNPKTLKIIYEQQTQAASATDENPEFGLTPNPQYMVRIKAAVDDDLKFAYKVSLSYEVDGRERTVNTLNLATKMPIPVNTMAEKLSQPGNPRQPYEIFSEYAEPNQEDQRIQFGIDDLGLN